MSGDRSRRSNPDRASWHRVGLVVPPGADLDLRNPDVSRLRATPKAALLDDNTMIVGIGP